MERSDLTLLIAHWDCLSLAPELLKLLLPGTRPAAQRGRGVTMGRQSLALSSLQVAEYGVKGRIVMDRRKLPDFDAPESDEVAALLKDGSPGTLTIDLGGLLTPDVSSSGSFDIKGVHRTALGELLDALPTPAFLVDNSESILFSNEASGRVMDKFHEMVFSAFTGIFVRRKDKENALQALRKVFRERSEQVIEAGFGTKGNRMWGRMHMRSIRIGAERFVLVLVQDLTPEKRQVVMTKKYTEELQKARANLEQRVQERTVELARANTLLKRQIGQTRQAQKSLKLAAKVVSSSSEAIVITDSQANIVDVNESFCRITGYSREEVIGRNPRMMTSGRHDRQFWRQFWQTLVETGHWQGEVWDRRKGGEIFPKLLSVSAVKSDEGDVTHYVGFFSDITRMKESEERLERMAHFDPLTSLPNRLLFRDRLQQALMRADRERTSAALMFLDLDGFKDVNDTLGHRVGDKLLADVAGRILKCVRKGDTVARLGGDEFTVVMSGIMETTQVIGIAHRIIEAFRRPIRLEGNEVFITASIGVSLYPHDGSDVDQLLKSADTAMYHAKEQGKNNFQFFSQEMNAELLRSVEIESRLRRSMQEDKLMVYYQPMVECKNHRITAIEALLRLRNGDGEALPAGPFIPVAEEKGLITRIGEWVLLTACRQNKLWQSSGFPALRVAVNISPRQLRDPTIVKRTLQLLDKAGLDPRFLELEVTETAMMSDTDLSIKALHEFRSHGITISVDDFGTGYSALNYLKRLPIDKLKIDRSFVEDLPSDAEARALFRAIVGLAHSLGLRVVSEGVETEEQFNIVCKEECDAVQGYYMSPPVPASDFEQIVRRHRHSGSY